MVMNSHSVLPNDILFQDGLLITVCERRSKGVATSMRNECESRLDPTIIGNIQCIFRLLIDITPFTTERPISLSIKF